MTISAISFDCEERALGGEDQRRFSPPAYRLLEAADKLFYSQGVPATTVREITSACGLSPGALYNHFNSKDDLLYVLVGHRHLRLERDIIAAQKLAAGNPVSEFVAIIGVYVRAHAGGKAGSAGGKSRVQAPERASPRGGDCHSSKASGPDGFGTSARQPERTL